MLPVMVTASERFACEANEELMLAAHSLNGGKNEALDRVSCAPDSRVRGRKH
jgi:hypothetical protein